jgi:hypothetical protein
MKNSTLVVFLFLMSFVSLKAERPAGAFGTNNIVLKTFQAIQVPNGAKVIWEFTSEEKDVTCNLEKSTDGINFTRVSTIVLTSTRMRALHSFLDKEAGTGQTFYRLHVTKESFIPYTSPIVSVNMARAGVIPQGGMLPGRSSLFGELSMQEDLMSVRLLDLNGQARIKTLMKGTELESSFRASFSNLPTGYYVLRVKNAENKDLLNKFIYKF